MLPFPQKQQIAETHGCLQYADKLHGKIFLPHSLSLTKELTLKILQKLTQSSLDASQWLPVNFCSV